MVGRNRRRYRRQPDLRHHQKPIIRAPRAVAPAGLSIRDALMSMRLRGRLSSARIILRHMAPTTCFGPYLILLTAYIAQAILLEAFALLRPRRQRADAGLGP